MVLGKYQTCSLRMLLFGKLALLQNLTQLTISATLTSTVFYNHTVMDVRFLGQGVDLAQYMILIQPPVF